MLYPGSANPGRPGTAVIIGHSSPPDLPWTEYSSVFHCLENSKPTTDLYNCWWYPICISDPDRPKGGAQQLISSGLAGDLIVSTCWPIGTDTNRVAVGRESGPLKTYPHTHV